MTPFPSCFLAAHSSTTSSHKVHSPTPSVPPLPHVGLITPLHQKTLCSPPCSSSPHLRHSILCLSPPSVSAIQYISPLTILSLVYAVHALQLRIHLRGIPLPHAFQLLGPFLAPSVSSRSYALSSSIPAPCKLLYLRLILLWHARVYVSVGATFQLRHE